MDLGKLSRVSDSSFGAGSEALKAKKKADALKALKSRLKAKIMDTEDTESVIEAAVAELATEDPESVLQTTVEILDDVVTSLTGQVEDSKKKIALLSKSGGFSLRKKSDAATKAAFKKKLMDTEDTASVIEAAKAELETTDPATVVETVIEVLDEVIENLSNE